MRAFVAVELPEAARAALAVVQGELARTLRGWRFPRADAIHLTLRFLGEIDDRVEHEARPRFAAAARTITPFDLETGALGCFPDARRPRVLWIGVVEVGGGSRLARLAAAIEDAARAVGLAPEPRAFAGHLTLARSAREGHPAAPARHVPPVVSIPVTELVLFESRLEPTGARYTARARFPLGDSSGTP